MTVGALIVGAGHAGVQVASSLRDLGYDKPITLVSDERYLPYQRPPLSKTFLTGFAAADTLALRAERYYRERSITVLTDDHLADVTLADVCSGSGTAVTSSGVALPFEHLAIATGASARQLEVPGCSLPGICYLRGLDDAVRLKALLPAAQRVVVIGGGFIGLEGAAFAQSAGKQVTIVEATDRLVARAVPSVVGDFYRTAHQRRGTRVLLGAAVSHFLGEDRVTGVALADGRILAADLVLVGVGAVPRTGLAERLLIRCDQGVLVDSRCRTSNPRIVAAGDCTRAPHPMAPHQLVRLESVNNAVCQGRVAAASLLGMVDHYGSVPWFWSDQGAIKLQMVGTFDCADSHVLRGDPADEKFSILHYRDQRLTGLTSINCSADFIAARKALESGKNIPADQASDPSRRLKDLLAEPALIL
ncbi:ferredoxin [Rhodococcus sp. ABRD24]|uniref:NAD(P)/FAD-dependent oxidoreductase n=1 Tax=Rhodococcus sp. ABRD24 TaxID=2507582 RepID=UPI00103AE6AE|nr:FAD-dependent oxidoreductase [Rhodococcus sp. ABRD24]QBJ97326.1 ferredoxin [Rhodococcus sp. ABRD24]